MQQLLRSSLLACTLFACAAPVGAHQAIDPAILRLVKPPLTPSPTGISRKPGTDLVEAGRKLFFQETFGGNGRTCGTCHRAERNFTIDAEFIGRLPAADPLFVGEKPPLIGLENPVLMRKFGLILENLDGFAKPGVLRGVPHTLGLGFSTDKIDGLVVNGVQLKGAMGWSGDGAPGKGTLREFALGAVVQHFTKRLNRVPGTDFVLPTDEQLKALAAFQLSTGRQTEAKVDAASVRYLDDTVARGQVLFHGAPAKDDSTRSCAFCHNNAGATTTQANNKGANFDTGVRSVANAPACLDSEKFPGAPADGGFGFAENRVTLCGQTMTAFGDGSFNTPSVVEAADTPPFFHNNSSATIEDAVRFYTTDTFGLSPDGQNDAGGNRAFVLSEDEVKAVAAFLRAINALDNIASAKLSLEGAIGRPSLRDLLKDPAVRDINDAIKVLSRGPIRLYASTQPTLSLVAAIANIARGRLPQAQVDLERAHSLMAVAP